MLRVNTLFKSVCYHPLEHQIVSTGTDRKIGFWETYDGSLIRELDGSLTDSVNALDVSDDGVYVVSGGSDKIIKVSPTVSFSLFVCLSPGECLCLLDYQHIAHYLCVCCMGSRVRVDGKQQQEWLWGGAPAL